MCIAITLTEKIGVIPKNVNEFSTMFENDLFANIV